MEQPPEFENQEQPEWGWSNKMPDLDWDPSEKSEEFIRGWSNELLHYKDFLEKHSRPFSEETKHIYDKFDHARMDYYHTPHSKDENEKRISECAVDLLRALRVEERQKENHDEVVQN